MAPEVNKSGGEGPRPAGGFLVKGTVQLGDLVVGEERVEVEEGPEREGGAPGQADEEEE